VQKGETFLSAEGQGASRKAVAAYKPKQITASLQGDAERWQAATQRLKNNQDDL
jgi:hypothetical protein